MQEDSFTAAKLEYRIGIGMHEHGKLFSCFEFLQFFAEFVRNAYAVNIESLPIFKMEADFLQMSSPTKTLMERGKDTCDFYSVLFWNCGLKNGIDAAKEECHNEIQDKSHDDL